MANKYRTIEDCLFDAFANPSFRDPQEHKQFWAIREASLRYGGHGDIFKETKAQKEHQCVRNCIIQRGDKYFRYLDSFNTTKLCASCMAMIFYFSRAWVHSTYMYDHWDVEKQAAVWLNEKRHPDAIKLEQALRKAMT